MNTICATGSAFVCEVCQPAYYPYYSVSKLSTSTVQKSELDSDWQCPAVVPSESVEPEPTTTSTASDSEYYRTAVTALPMALAALLVDFKFPGQARGGAAGGATGSAVPLPGR